MKVLIIYFSTYKNNTEMIAKIMADKVNADIINLKSAKDIPMASYDLIGFGSGVYKESMAPQLLKWAEKVELNNKNTFVFSTSGVGMKSYNKKLIKILKSKGANCRGSFACKGSFVSKEFSNVKLFEIISKFAKGHPNLRDRGKAEKFIEKVTKYSLK